MISLRRLERMSLRIRNESSTFGLRLCTSKRDATFATQSHSMTYNDIIGFIGVFITLLAYFLIIFDFIPKEGVLFYVMNIVGAGLACYASILIVYWPFVVLEGTWTLISLVGLIKLLKVQPQE